MIPFFQTRTTLLQAVYTNTLSFYPLHLHNSLEILYVTDGSLTLNYKGSDYIIETGELAVIFPCMIHGYTLMSPEQNASCILINCQKALTDLFNPILYKYQPLDPIIHNVDEIKNVSDFLYELIPLGYENLNSDNAKSTGYTLYLTTSLMQTVIARLLPHLELVSGDSIMEPKRLSQLLLYISEHFKEELSLAKVAATLNVSPGYISRIFVEQIHMGFVDYLHKLRVEYAKGLLSTTNLSILHIALECGFGNLRSFNRIFKELVHCTPSQYRKERLTYQSSLFT